MLKELVRRTMPAEAISVLRAVKLYYSTRTYHPKVVRHRYGESSFSLHINDPFAEHAYDHDWSELKELSLLKRHQLQPGATVFNLGAHQGVVALMLADDVGETGQVIAVEASPYSAGICEANRAANKADNLKVINAAIAAEQGSLRFADSLCGHVDDGHGGIEVPARTIDDLMDEYGHPAILFIDIEGFECEALRGASRTLSIGSDCFVEVHGGVGLEKYGGSVAKVLSFFPADDYELFFAIEEGAEFSPLTDRTHVTERLQGKRWFLVATSKRKAPNSLVSDLNG